MGAVANVGPAVLLASNTRHPVGVELQPFDFWVHVRPGGRRDALEGAHDGVLAVRVVEPPTEGRANHAVCKVLAGAFGVARLDVKVVGGRTGKRKLIRIYGEPVLLARRLAELLGDPGSESSVAGSTS